MNKKEQLTSIKEYKQWYASKIEELHKFQKKRQARYRLDRYKSNYRRRRWWLWPLWVLSNIDISTSV